MRKPPVDIALFPGKSVLVRGSKTKGEILEGPNKKGEWKVSLGSVHLWIKPSEISEPKISKQVKPPRSSASDTLESDKVLSLDLHGKTGAEAESLLWDLLNRALLENAHELEIIHGHGKGVVLAVVESFLKKNPQIRSFRRDPRNPGVTKANL